jgi:hypothetical protein
MPSSVTVTKVNGEKEPFSFKKVYNSALRAGAPESAARDVAKKIEGEVYQGMKTADIFKKVRQELKKSNLQAAIRFNLKEGIKKLGPAGFVFEKYIREILINYGFNVEIAQIVSGRCANHEVDFLAVKEGNIYVGECKYRNNQGDKVDLNVCLKGFAVLEDVKATSRFRGYNTANFLVVTNSKFTNQAVKYSNCQGIKLIGWRYPEDQGLEYMIDKKKLYPITILPSLKGYLLSVFCKEGFMLAEDVLNIDIEKFSKKGNIPESQINNLRNEARALLGYN